MYRTNSTKLYSGSTALPGELSSAEVELLLQRTNKMVRKLLSEDPEVRGKVVAINPYGAKLIELQEKILLFNEFVADKNRLEKICSSSSEIFLELCSGSGRHLIEQSAQKVSAIHFGVELRLKRTVRTIEKAILRGCDNLIMLRTNAELIGNIFPAKSLSGCWVNFPDPWERTRDHKHRVLSRSLLDRLSWMLKAGGFLGVRTDHSGYFEDFLSIAENDNRFELVELSRDFHQSEFSGNAILTEFESLFISQGLPINHLKLRRL